jgi:hypothetical protein
MIAKVQHLVDRMSNGMSMAKNRNGNTEDKADKTPQND